jgi:spermidine/putrescine-binding protein
MTNSKNNYSIDLSRRKILKAAGVLGLASTTIGGFSLSALASGRKTLTMADIGVGDPGDWTQFTSNVGYDVNVVAIGNAPSAIVNQLIAGGGTSTYDIINIVGGMQKPLAQADLIQEIDTARLPNWDRNSYIADYLAKGSPGFGFISHEDRIYGVPTVLQADSFAYLPDETGELDSYAALFDERFRGYVALEDNYTTSAQKTALYLKTSNLATIDDPSDMTPGEINTVIDFLIEKKKEGQFRVIWSSFEQAVNLLVSKEVFVMDCWEPMVFAANQQGANVKYADPKEGYLMWAMAAYIVNNPSHTEADITAAYELLNFMLGPWYGATITSANGYLTNPQAADYAAANPELFDAETAARIQAIASNGKAKFQRGGTWQNRWPTNVDYYEEAWQRFMSS